MKFQGANALWPIEIVATAHNHSKNNIGGDIIIIIFPSKLPPPLHRGFSIQIGPQPYMRTQDDVDALKVFFFKLGLTNYYFSIVHG